MFDLYCDGLYLGWFSEFYCRSFCRQFANSHHVKCVEVK